MQRECQYTKRKSPFMICRFSLSESRFSKKAKMHGSLSKKRQKNAEFAKTYSLKTALKTTNERAILLSSTNGM